MPRHALTQQHRVYGWCEKPHLPRSRGACPPCRREAGHRRCPRPATAVTDSPPAQPAPVALPPTEPNSRPCDEERPRPIAHIETTSRALVMSRLTPRQGRTLSVCSPVDLLGHPRRQESRDQPCAARLVGHRPHGQRRQSRRGLGCRARRPWGPFTQKRPLLPQIPETERFKGRL